MHLAACGKTHQGRVRSDNQDTFDLYPDHNFFLVADGMGGMNAGRTAAEMSVSEVAARFLQGEPPQTPQRLLEVAREVSHSIWQEASSNRAMHGMGATLVAAWMENGDAHVLNAGDSRVYLFRNGNLRQLTEDHSVVEGLIKQGYISREQARVHPCRNQLTRHMGLRALQAELVTVTLQVQDRLLLCSDGLTKELSDEQIVATLSVADLEECCQKLVDDAVAAGGRDNVTVVLVDCLAD